MRRKFAPLGVVVLLGSMLAIHLSAVGSSRTDPGTPKGDGPQLDVELVADGLTAPLSLTFAPDGSGRRFIVDQTGLVLILSPDGEVLSTPFLDISA